jgi:hypothetical protein
MRTGGAPSSACPRSAPPTAVVLADGVGDAPVDGDDDADGLLVRDACADGEPDGVSVSDGVLPGVRDGVGAAPRLGDPGTLLCSGAPPASVALTDAVSVAAADGGTVALEDGAGEPEGVLVGGPLADADGGPLADGVPDGVPVGGAGEPEGVPLADGEPDGVPVRDGSTCRHVKDVLAPRVGCRHVPVGKENGYAASGEHAESRP